MKPSVPCTLCGLPAMQPVQFEEETFCCNGCRMVYTMLMESETDDDSRDFTKTDLYRQCVAAGIIPDTQIPEPPDNGSARLPDEHSPTSDQVDLEDNPLTADMDCDNLLSCRFKIHNMWCPACAWVLEQALTGSSGVKKAVCNFSSDQGHVRYDPVVTSPDKIFKTIQKFGYEPSLYGEKQPEKTKEFIRISISFFLTMNVMMLSWAIYSGFFIELTRRSVQLLAWPVFLMTTLVVFYGGYPIFKKDHQSIRTGWPGMETLISTGIAATYLYSFVHLFLDSIHFYFDASCMLVMLTLTGKMLERAAKKKISQGFETFYSLIPKKVKICTDQFPRGRFASIRQLVKGDIFVAQEGEILAADGVVIKGSAVVDESSVTGEAKPVHLDEGVAVKSGSRVTSGTIKIKASSVGEESVIGRMLAIMETSLSGKSARSERFGTLLKLFVPGIIGLSLITVAFWLVQGLSFYEAFNRGVSVLVISCPCALGIAIPLALVAGVTAAGQKGILIRNFDAFEKTEDLNSIVFDKTGTLTTGEMVVLGVNTFEGVSENAVWPIICAIEKDSDHYIAQTIRKYGARNNITAKGGLEQVTHHENGISCRIGSETYRFGNLAFVRAKIPEATPLNTSYDRSAQVISTVYLATAGRIIASVHLGDSIKDGILPLMSDLKAQGFLVHLISGDAHKATLMTGSAVNIPAESIRGGQLPHEKANYIKALVQSGSGTAMIGDGLNDAPAMAGSDIAFAVHSGLNPGNGVAAVTFMRETPVQLLDFLDLTRMVNRKVKQNLAFAFFYNTVSIPLAASGVLNPIIAATAMLLSSLSVTLNTLLLVKKSSR